MTARAPFVVSRVILGAAKIPVRLNDEEQDDLGSFHETDGIEVRSDLPDWSKAEVLLHECLHALWTLNHLPETVDEETLCTRIDTALLGFIQDNPGLIRAIQNVKRGKPLLIADAVDD